MSENKVVKVTIENGDQTDEREFKTLMFAGIVGEDGDVGVGLSTAGVDNDDVLSEELDAIFTAILFILTKSHPKIKNSDDLMRMVASTLSHVITEYETMEIKGDVQ